MVISSPKCGAKRPGNAKAPERSPRGFEKHSCQRAGTDSGVVVMAARFMNPP
jgi:hypothetical protein